MIRIQTLLIGVPRDLTGEKGAWRSAIYRTPVEGPVELLERGLAGDQVADTKHHGQPHQAVCCHPLDHYAYWNAVYDLRSAGSSASDTAKPLGPGSVGENWTIEGATEQDVCVGDVFAVGTARVQVTTPRVPCSKQERRTGLPDYLRRVLEALRTGWYLRVLTPGKVRAGDEWRLEARPYPELTIERINVCLHRSFDPALARRLLEIPEFPEGWKGMFRSKLVE